jgi:hypothetical protein
MQKHRPSGLEFACCNNCNAKTSAADVVAAFIARLDAFEEVAPWKFKEAKALRSMVDIKAPGLISELVDQNESKTRWVRGPNGLLRKVQEIKATGRLLRAYLSVFSAKLGAALYREHVGVPLQLTGAVSTNFYLNRGLTKQTMDILLRIAPTFGTLQQGGFQVPEQFAYRFNTDEKTIVYAIAQFHSNLTIVLMATSKPEFFIQEDNPLFRYQVKPEDIVNLMPQTS